MKPRETAWRYADARGNFRYRGAKENFDRDYAILKPDPLYDRDAVAVAVAAERERCARLCDEIGATMTAQAIREGA